MTRANVIDMIRSMIYGGMPPDSAEITKPLVNSYLNAALGLVIKKNYQERYAVDQVGSVADGFYMTLSPYTLSLDSATGYYTFQLPTLPISISDNVSTSDVFVVLKTGIKKECSRITRRELQVMFELPLDLSEIYYWVEGNNTYLWSQNNISGLSVYVRVPYSESTDINSLFNCPSDMIGDVIQFVLTFLGVEAKSPSMNNNENVETRNIRPNE